jgi:hypothetical protein
MKMYEIQIKENLDIRWQKHFKGFEFSYNESQNTVLKGSVQDQSNLQAILEKLFNLNLTILEMRALPARLGGTEKLIAEPETH